MIKILYLLNDFRDISINRNILKLASHLTSTQFQVYILTLNHSGTIKSKFTKQFGRNVYTSDKSFLSGILMLRKIILENNISIVQSQTLRADLTVILVKLLLKDKIGKDLIHISNRRNYLFLPCEPRFFWKNVLYFFSCHLADLNICVANHISHKLISKLHVPSQRVNTIFNGVRIRNIKTLNRKLISTPPLIIYTGQLIKRKNVICLLRALSVITLPYKCLIIGDGPEKQSLVRYINEQKLEDKITFIPFTTNINRYLSKADIFVLPSLAEGMSMSLLEAMNFGLSCIVSDIDANTELINHMENGLIHPINNFRILAESITILLSNKSIMNDLKNSTRQTIIKTYNQISLFQKYTKTYIQYEK